MNTENPLYSDLDLNFIRHPRSRDFMPQTNVHAVKRSIRHLLSLDQFDIPFNSYVFPNIKGLLFELYSPPIENILKNRIREVITKYEPRVRVEDVNADFDNDNQHYTVTIRFYVIEYNVSSTLTLVMERLR